MKRLVVPLLACAALMGVASPSWADHWHGRVGISIGVPLGYPWYYPPYYYPPPYYPPTVVTVPSQPPVYVEQNEAPRQSGYWYYCRDPEGYYPYVKQCPGGWEPVSPTPPEQR